MTEDVHALVGAYALDAVDGEERVAFEEHLANCGDCQAELPGMQAAAARLGGAHVAEPPAHLRQQVMDRISRTRQQAPVVRHVGSRRTPWRSLVAVAAAVVVVAGGFGIAVEQSRVGDAQRRGDLIAAVVSDPGKQEATVSVTGGGTAQVTWVKGAALVTMRGMPPAPAHHTYQLWKKLPDESVVSLGVIGARPTKPIFVDHLGDSTALAVTVEPAGGVRQPTTTPTVVVPI